MKTEILAQLAVAQNGVELRTLAKKPRTEARRREKGALTAIVVQARRQQEAMPVRPNSSPEGSVEHNE